MVKFNKFHYTDPTFIFVKKHPEKLISHFKVRQRTQALSEFFSLSAVFRVLEHSFSHNITAINIFTHLFSTASGLDNLPI